MTADTETRVTIRRLTGTEDQLLHIYDGSQGPQGCFIALDLRDGAMWADYNAEIGNAIPFDVYHGIVRRYSIPALPASRVNDLMDQIAPYAQAILDHSEIIWDGSNHVARLDDDAHRAEEAIVGDDIDGHGGILSYEMLQDEQVEWWDAGDWFEDSRSDLTREFRSGASVAEVMERELAQVESDRITVVGMERYLQSLADEAADEMEED